MNLDRDITQCGIFVKDNTNSLKLGPLAGQDEGGQMNKLLTFAADKQPSDF